MPAKRVDDEASQGKHDLSRMRKEELQLFEARCDDRDFEDAFAEAVGLPLLPVHEFGRELLNDLDTGEIFGFGWWSEYHELGDRRRIFIADCLIQAVQSVAVNLVEAKLHLLETIDWLDRESIQMRDAIVAVDARPKLRSRTAAKEGLPERMIVLHSAGFFRAINSAFDCLGGALVGVGGLPENIRRADLTGARKALAATKPLDTRGGRAQAQLGISLELEIDRAGSKGWLQWAMDFRNMLAHRGRRMHPATLRYRDTLVTDHRERPFALTEVHRAFPVEPSWSEIESILLHRPQTLGEASLETMRGILDSSVLLAEATVRHLQEFWRVRRREPTTIRQPAKQWKLEQPQSAGFDGYSGTFAAHADVGVMHPSDVIRLQAAALGSRDRWRWEKFT